MTAAFAQATRGAAAGLQHRASSHGGSESSLHTQLGFLWHELKGPESGALKALRTTHDPPSAATVWDKHFERSAGTSRGARISSAHSISKAIQSGKLGGGGGNKGSHGGHGGKAGSTQRLVVHPSELADVISQVGQEADTAAYIVRGMTRHVAELDALLSSGQVVPDPARYNLARRGLEEALTESPGRSRPPRGSPMSRPG